MSLQEKKVITNLSSTIVIFAVFLMVVLQRYNAQSLDIAGELVFWAKAVLIFIPVSVVARIIILIVFHIGDRIAGEIKGEIETEYDVHDERDKLFELKSTRISLVVFSAGFIVGLGLLAFSYGPTAFFIVMLVFGFASDIASASAKFLFYKRGY
jgi:uncharacterized oligopeptide transporter (OPT) family protein